MMLTAANREAFDGSPINLGDGEIEDLSDCVWDAPKGFPSKPVLSIIYGAELEPLFRDILDVPNTTSAEAHVFLAKLRGVKSTALADVIEVYLFLQAHYPNE
jgi:hypothetical protein